MTYDRDEWRRPWRTGDGPDADRPGAGTDRDLPPPGTDTGAAGSTDAPTASRGVTATSHDRPSQGPRPAGEVSPGQPAMGSWQRPDGTTAVAPVAGVDPTQPITRFPQPPPTGWDERSSGPGSPPGSVRPPDTTGTVDAPAGRPKGRSPVLLLVVAIIGGAIGAGAFAGIDALTDRDTVTAVDEAGETVAAPTIEPLSEGSVVPAVAEAVTPSVVRIDVSSGDGDGLDGMGAGLGSGVIYRSDGYILTNHHVINGADDITVRLASGEDLAAEVIGSDELNDLAVLQVDRDGLPAVNQRSVDEPITVGETVVAIGSPFGLDASVTSGIISALDREIPLDSPDGAGVQTITSVLQTDAAINPGNSGGALVDAQGSLVGINTAILSRSGASQGVGFAVNADQAVSAAEQLIEQGFVRHALLGIAGESVTPSIAEDFGLESARGAIVESVEDDSGADAAGIRPGDTITEVDGEVLATMSQLVAEVRRRAPGEVVELTILRDGEESVVEVELGERPR